MRVRRWGGGLAFPVLAMTVLLAGCSKHPDTTAQTQVRPPDPGSQPMALPCQGLSGPQGVKCLFEAGNKYRLPSPAPVVVAPVQVNCAGVSGQKAPPGLPSDDVLGVRGEMVPADAMKVLQCQKPAYTVDPESTGGNFGVPPMPDGTMAKNGFNAEVGGSQYGPALDKVEVAYVGLPGKEVVAGAARQATFPPGKQPSLDDLRSTLVSKYGQPEGSLDNPGILMIYWVYAPDGKPLMQGTQQYNDCISGVNTSAGLTSSPACGVVVAASITRSSDNPKSVSHFEVSAINQAKVYAQALQASNYVKNLRGSGGKAPTM